MFDNFLFDVIGDMTNGLIVDSKTLLTSLLVLGFLLFGWRIIFGALRSASVLRDSDLPNASLKSRSFKNYEYDKYSSSNKEDYFNPDDSDSDRDRSFFS